MNKKLILWLLLYPFWVIAQKSPVLLQIGEQSVTAEEFEYLYNKNFDPKRDKRDEQGLREYLDLFIKFKLKVAAAREKKIDSSPDFIREFQTYRAQIAKPYLTEKKVTEQLLQQAYERTTTEVRVSHILILASPRSAPADTLRAYKLISDIYERAIKGEDFSKLALETSQDESVVENKGDLGYFSAFSMVYEFENAAFSTPVGQISRPFRTDFGYHILKVHDKRPSRGTVYVSHLMIMAREGMSPEDSIAAQRNAEQLRARLDAGEDWKTLVKKYSEDQRTKDSGGELQAITSGSLPPQLSNFVDAAFALNQPGELAGPIKTPYGWHIIRLDKKVPVESFEKLKPTLESKIQRDSRSQLPQKAFINRIKKENGFKPNFKNVVLALSAFDSSILAGKWRYDSASPNLNRPLFTIGKTTYTTRQFYAFAKEKQNKVEGFDPQGYAASLYREFEDKCNIEYEEAALASKYPDFRNLEREYREGLMLFRIMEEEVWGRATKDSAGLAAFFAQKAKNYQWKERVEAVAAVAEKPATLDSVIADIKLPRYPIPNEEIPYNVSLNSIEISQAFKTFLDRTSAKMRRNDYLTLDLISQKAETESDSLEERRIQEVINYLTSYKVDASRIQVIRQPTPIAGQPRMVFALFANSKKYLESLYNSRVPLSVKIYEGRFEPKDNPIIDLHFGKLGEYRGTYDGKPYYVLIKSVIPAQPKLLSEVRGQVISDYQNYLEEKWLESLRNHFKVQVNEATLKKIIEKYAKSAN